VGIRNTQGDSSARHALARKNVPEFGIDKAGVKHVADRCDFDLFKKLDDRRRSFPARD